MAKTGKKKTQPQRRKHIPQRTCVGCRTVQAKRSLTRIVRSPDGVRIDLDGKMAGRGAYLHNTQACWQLGLKGKLARALKTEISAGELTALKEFMLTLPIEDESDETELDASD